MNIDLALVLALFAAAAVMFARGKPRMDAMALLMLVILPLTGVVCTNEALAGFSDANVILTALLFVIGEGLVRTGVAQRLGDWLVAKAGNSETRVLVLLMAVVGGLGSVMSSTGVIAIFIPIVLRIAQNTGTAPSRLMMPMSVAALISGMMTLVATAPNLVIDAELRRSGAAGLEFFSFTPFGLLPFSLALQRTGGVDLAADVLIAAVGGAGPRIVLASLFAITALLGLFISNTATAVLMASVALAMAKDLGASPYPFAMTVALAASAAFMTPVLSPVNTLVVGPGNYAFGDFVKIGVPFTVVAMAVSVVLVPILLPL